MRYGAGFLKASLGIWYVTIVMEDYNAPNGMGMPHLQGNDSGGGPEAIYRHGSPQNLFEHTSAGGTPNTLISTNRSVRPDRFVG